MSYLLKEVYRNYPEEKLSKIYFHILENPKLYCQENLDFYQLSKMIFPETAKKEYFKISKSDKTKKDTRSKFYPEDFIIGLELLKEDNHITFSYENKKSFVVALPYLYEEAPKLFYSTWDLKENWVYEKKHPHTQDPFRISILKFYKGHPLLFSFFKNNIEDIKMNLNELNDNEIEKLFERKMLERFHPNEYKKYFDFNEYKVISDRYKLDSVYTSSFFGQDFSNMKNMKRHYIPMGRDSRYDTIWLIHKSEYKYHQKFNNMNILKNKLKEIKFYKMVSFRFLSHEIFDLNFFPNEDFRDEELFLKKYRHQINTRVIDYILDNLKNFDLNSNFYSKEKLKKFNSKLYYLILKIEKERSGIFSFVFSQQSDLRERRFQNSLVKELKEVFKNINIKEEVRSISGLSRIDLMIHFDNKVLPVELKHDESKWTYVGVEKQRQFYDYDFSDLKNKLDTVVVSPKGKYGISKKELFKYIKNLCAPIK